MRWWMFRLRVCHLWSRVNHYNWNNTTILFFALVVAGFFLLFFRRFFAVWSLRTISISWKYVACGFLYVIKHRIAIGNTKPCATTFKMPNFVWCWEYAEAHNIKAWVVCPLELHRAFYAFCMSYKWNRTRTQPRLPELFNAIQNER